MFVIVMTLEEMLEQIQKIADDQNTISKMIVKRDQNQIHITGFVSNRSLNKIMDLLPRTNGWMIYYSDQNGLVLH